MHGADPPTRAPAGTAALNDPQRAAVEHEAGPLLVFAGAGSGKTRVITHRIARLLEHHRVPPYRVLAVTFTNKAAAEMRARVSALAGPEVTSDLWAGTFHAVCARLLRRYHAEVGLERSFTIYDDSDQRALVARVAKTLGYDDRQHPPKQVLSWIHAQKREARAPGEAEPILPAHAAAAEIYGGYQRALAAANAVDFDDLLLHVMRLAESESPAGSELRARFSHVLVDEFQDTNAVQYRLVRALAARERNVCVVGDDDQSIYRWRGADVRIILGFRRDFPDAAVVKLEQNYRSTANVVRAALAVIEPAREREPKRLWTASPPGDPICIRGVRDEREEATMVVRQVAEERARGVGPRDIAVFYRTHAQSRVLEEAFRGARIPYQVIGGHRFFDRAEVKDLLAYLRLIANPRSDADLLRVVNVPTRGIGDKTIDRVLSVAAARGTSAWDAIDAAASELGSGPRSRLVAFRDAVAELRRAAPGITVHDLAERVLETTGYRAALVKADDAESDARLENLAELLGSIQEWEDETRGAGREPELADYLERVALASAVDLAGDEGAVSLMTVHAAKGLEFRVVLLTGMEEEVFPYRGLDGAAPEELDEERRLAYVAITRARERLVASFATLRTLFGRTRWGEPSRFLEALPSEIVRGEGLARDFGQRRASSRRAPGERWVEPEEAACSASAWGDDPAREVTTARPTGAAARSAEPAEAPAAGPRLRRGDAVRHARFGRGVVESGDGASIVSVRFATVGTKRIDARFLERAAPS
ncbi:MAG: UvrD-helicase domain-containing protein [Polyangiaceae bacterium]|nr:UvrD-helicase domain-containing protein [Polyangiaceae bacterium]